MTFEALQNKTMLTNKVSIYIPSKINISKINIKTIDNSEYVEAVMKKMSLLFGGATAYNASGAWMSEEKGLIIENVTIIYSYCDGLKNEEIDKVINICEWLKNELQQEAVSLEVNGKLYFI
jgi:hypothetical protein